MKTQTKTKNEYIYTDITRHSLTDPKFFYIHLHTVSVSGERRFRIPRTFNNPVNSFLQFITVVHMRITFVVYLKHLKHFGLTLIGVKIIILNVLISLQ
jgi:hypothetical protein